MKDLDVSIAWYRADRVAPLSTDRMADLIVVLDGGRIVEAGSHEQLRRAPGLYAELYELQSRAYR